MSLRGRILVLTVAVAGLVLAIFTVPLVLLLQQAARESALEKATDLTQGVADYVSSSSDGAKLAQYVKRVNDRSDDFPVRVDLPGGTHVGADLAGIPTPRHDDNPVRDPDGDGDYEGDFARTSSAEVRNVAGGRLVTVDVAGSAGPTVVSTYVPSSKVRETVLRRLLVLSLAAGGALIGAVVAAELVSRRLVRGLATTARTADRLSEGDLEARAPEDGPAEVRRVATALNRLAGRIDELLVLERETVADLSHRLRTPLTAVRLDVEALPADPARAELEDHLDLLERTLTAVIHAARRPEREGVSPHCDAAAVTRERVDFWTPLVEEQGRPVHLDLAPSPLAVRCADRDLAAALDALLENVVAHTDDGTALAVVLRAEAGDVVLEVRDQGPGIPHGSLGRGRSDRGSSGLGLDIARACAESSGGRLQTAREGDWTVVRLRLGLP